MYSEATID